MFLELKMQKHRRAFSKIKMEYDRCQWFSHKLHCKKSANNLFRSKEPTNKVPRNIFRGFEARKKGRLMFRKPQRTAWKLIVSFFSTYKKRNKVPFVYLQYTLQQYRYGWRVLKLKCQETLETTSLETRK